MGVYATASDVAAYTGGDVDEARATLLCQLASASIDVAAGRPISSTERADTVTGTGGPAVWLHWPVTAVETVTVDGAAVDPSGYRFERDGRLTRAGGVWPAGSAVAVTYTCGWDDGAPQMLLAKRICLEAVAAELSNPDRLASETIGDWARSWNPAAEPETSAQLAQMRSRLG